MSRKVNKYLLSIPVESWQDAQLLGSETNWRILEKLRDVGSQGLSAKEISEEVGIPKSTVYGALKSLQAADWVQSSARPPVRSSWGRPSREAKPAQTQRRGGKPTKAWIENLPVGISPDEDFQLSLEKVLERLKEDVEGLKEKWLLVFEKIISKYQEDEQLKKFFPQEPIHEECGWSHEGLEFLVAINFSLATEILNGEKGEEFSKRYKFKK